MNLAYEQEAPQQNVVKFPKKGQETMAKEEGYTPLPNFICDEGYLAALDGYSIKLLVLLNRHIVGFHKASEAIGEALVMKISGIDDKRTIRKYMAELAKFGLVSIIKRKGKRTTYQLTFEKRIAVQVVTQHVTTPVTPHVPSTPHALGTRHDTRAVTSHVPTTSDMACHPVKEIPLNKKENVVVDNNAEKFKPQNKPILNFIEYYPSDPKSYSLKDLCQIHSVESDFKAQAKVSFANLSDEIIQNQFSELCQWSLTASKLTSQKWMSTWIKFLKSAKPIASPVPQTASKPKPYNSKNVNDAWGEPKQYAPTKPKHTEGGQ